MMAWLKIDDEFVDNAKVASVSDRAFRLHVAGLCHSAHHLTDGYLSTKTVKVLGAKLEFAPKRYATELVGAVLWHERDDGWTINDYLTYNPDAATVKKLRDERSAAGKRGASQRWNDGKSDSNSHRQEPEQDASTDVDAPVPVPVPLPVNYLKAVTADEISREVQLLMRNIKNADEGTEGVLLSYARKLPLASVAKVRESCSSRKVGAGYAVNALRSELAEREEMSA